MDGADDLHKNSTVPLWKLYCMAVLQSEFRPITIIYNDEMFTAFVEYIPLKNLLPVFVGQAGVLADRGGVNIMTGIAANKAFAF